MASLAPTLNQAELEQLELFLKDWLRHSGRTQADLRRALRAGSIRMPVLLQELQRDYQQNRWQLYRKFQLWFQLR